LLKGFNCSNLLFLEDRDAIQRVGITGFSSPLKGSPVYDLASLLQGQYYISDESNEKALLDYYLKNNAEEFNRDAFLNDYYIIATQIACYNIGMAVYARIKYQNAEMLNMIENSWHYVLRNFDRCKALEPLSVWWHKNFIDVNKARI